MASKSFPKFLMFLVVLVLAAVVSAMGVSDELGNVYDDEHMLGIPTFGTSPGTTVGGPGTTVTETTATGTTATGAAPTTGKSPDSSETHGAPSTGTHSSSASTVSSGGPSSTRATSSQSSGQAGTTTSSGTHPTTAAPNEAVARGGMHNTLLVLAVTCVCFLMI
ncbi:SMP-30 gluconolaconase LRE domain protein [Aspergillus hancockii]|nr:SMP-30 gluconolaconase LRE domain protein [Aspergillus hancockii]